MIPAAAELITPEMVNAFVELFVILSELFRMTFAEMVSPALVLETLIWAFDTPLSNVSVFAPEIVNFHAPLMSPMFMTPSVTAMSRLIV